MLSQADGAPLGPKDDPLGLTENLQGPATQTINLRSDGEGGGSF